MKVFYERNKSGEYTGVTVCDVDGYRGYSFCLKDRMYPLSNGGYSALIDDGSAYPLTDVKDVYVKETGDRFNRKLGKTIAQGRAEKIKGLVNNGIPVDEAIGKIYSGRMVTRIAEFLERKPIFKLTE